VDDGRINVVCRRHDRQRPIHVVDVKAGTP
jgi:hypothetical protein